MPWLKKLDNGKEMMMSQDETELGIYDDNPQIMSDKCTCGQEKHRVSCPLGFQKYFPLKGSVPKYLKKGFEG